MNDAYGYSILKLIRETAMLKLQLPYEQAQAFAERICERMDETGCEWAETTNRKFTLAWEKGKHMPQQPDPNDFRNAPKEEKQVMRECVEAIIKALDKLAEHFEPTEPPTPRTHKQKKGKKK